MIGPFSNGLLPQIHPGETRSGRLGCGRQRGGSGWKWTRTVGVGTGVVGGEWGSGGNEFMKRRHGEVVQVYDMRELGQAHAHLEARSAF